MRIKENGRAHGDYGAETVEAVKAFPKKRGLEADGVYGSNTHKSLMAVLEALKESKPVLTTVVILSTEDGSVNVRAGNGAQYAILRIRLTTLRLLPTAGTPWRSTVRSDGFLASIRRSSEKNYTI